VGHCRVLLRSSPSPDRAGPPNTWSAWPRLERLDDEDSQVFEILERDGGAEVHFAHIGLVPRYECYDVCSIAWGRAGARLSGNRGIGMWRPESWETWQPAGFFPSPLSAHIDGRLCDDATERGGPI
jgi:hypothetical protein